MRIIGGQWRGRTIDALQGNEVTRPTTDRVREACTSSLDAALPEGIAGARVLDLGFGTASLTKRLYDAGCEVYGQDFSPRMVEVAQEKMPNALLIHRDFSSGLAPELARRTYDAIVATYSLHHLDDKSKRNLIDSLLPRLSERGCLYIGDVAFETRQELERCRAAAGDAWDPDEIYFVYDEFRGFFPAATFERVSPCSGIIIIPGVNSQLNEV